MINKELIDFISKRLNIDRKDLIEKDVMIRKILFHLMQDKDFSQNYVFKGGTCLTKCYFGYYRLSEDLDFSWIKQELFDGKSQKQIRNILSEEINKFAGILEDIAKDNNLDFKADKTDKKYIEFGGSNRFVTFKIKYKSAVQDGELFTKIQI